MIGFLSGKAEVFTKDSLLLNVNGVGYQVYVSQKLLLKPPHALFIYTHLREDSLDLYGFPTKEELHLFKLLINIPGIGPKIAIHVMDKGVAAITQAVSQADVDFFTTIPRLGHKNAQKIIIELKSKLGGLKELDLSGDTSETKEVISALISLGFTRSEVKEALNQVSDQLTLEAKISQAIKFLGRK